MNTKKLSNFMNRQPAKPVISSIRFSSLDDKDDDDADSVSGGCDDSNGNSASGIPIGVKSVNHTQTAKISSSVPTPEQTAGAQAKLRGASFSPPSVKKKDSTSSVESTTEKIVPPPPPAEKAEKFPQDDPMAEESTLTPEDPPLVVTSDEDHMEPPQSLSVEASSTLPQQQRSGVRRDSEKCPVVCSSGAKSATSSVSSDVSAADIFALLDTFQKEPNRRERRKPSEVAKSKPTTSTSTPTAARCPAKETGGNCRNPPLLQTTPPPLDLVDDAPTTADQNLVDPSLQLTQSLAIPADVSQALPSTKSKSVSSSPTVQRRVADNDNSGKVGRLGNAESEPDLLISGSLHTGTIKSTAAVDSPPDALLRQRSQTAAPSLKTERTAGTSSKKKPDMPSASVDMVSGLTDTMEQQRIQDVRVKALAVGAGLLFLLCIVRISSFLFGFFLGIGGAGSLCWLYLYLTTRSKPVSRADYAIPSMRDLPAPSIPEIAEEKDRDACRVHKGWMNEISSYIPDTYHINMTYSVMVRLEGTKLRLQRPKQNVSRRAMWNEKPTQPTFIHQRIHDLLHAQVTLEPPGLVRKRVWSKKYPICIVVVGGSSGGGVVKSTSSPSLHQQSRSWTVSGAAAKEGFEILGKEELRSQTIYLFARTCREKEEWFRRFKAASMGVPLNISLGHLVKTYLTSENQPGSSGLHDDVLTGGASSAGGGSSESTGGATSTSGSAGLQHHHQQKGHEPLLVLYLRYMAKFMPADWLLRACESQQRLTVNYISCDPPLLWFNAILGRVFWDLFREESWLRVIRDKIQSKLKKIHLPYFIDELTVVDMDLGTELPVIRRVGRPYLDKRGLWIDVDVAYAGGFVMALETKAMHKNGQRFDRQHCPKQPPSRGGDVLLWQVNLLKVKEQIKREEPRSFTALSRDSTDDGGSSETRSINREIRDGSSFILTDLDSASSTASKNGNSPGQESRDFLPSSPARVHSSAATNPEEEDSAESSTDSDLDEVDMQDDRSSASGGPASRRLFRFVDRITSSTYFHRALDNKYVQKGMEFVSNTRLVLQVEVQLLRGTLAVNMPPPPSDRLWYGFRGNPKLKLHARPRVGEKEVTMARITEWIEKKLVLEFQRVAVLPNMDDLVVPLLCAGQPERYGHNLH